MNQDPVFGHLFLSIGAMKAGTTWLYSVLEHHPELCFTYEKEIHYFHYKYVDRTILSEKRRLENAQRRYLTIHPDRNFIGRVRNNLHWVANYLDSPVDDFWYRNLFTLRRRESYDCDFSNLYALLPADVWPKIHADCEKLRVLYTMRDPVKRLWSHVKFHLEITKQTEKLESWAPEDYEAFARQPFIWRNSEYGACVRNLRKSLPQEAYKCLFFEDLHADQAGKLAEIESFLGVGHHTYPARVLNARVNESAARPMPDFFRGLFKDDFDRIADELTALDLAPPSSWSKHD